MGMLTQAMYLPSDVLEELSAFSGFFWSSFEQEPVICDAIRAFIKPKPPEQQLQQTTASDTGYQWKQLFLPEGTRLRASFGRQPYFASVEGTEIKCDGKRVSPSGFANLRGSGNRNAWKAVWLRFPGTNQWVLADACRALQKAAAERLFDAAAPAAAPTAATLPAQVSKYQHDPAYRPGILFREAANTAAVAVAVTPRNKKGKRGKRRAITT